MPSGAGRPPDYRGLYERERERADAAERCCEELRQSDRGARSRAGSLQRNLERCHEKRTAAEEEVRAVRRTAGNALFLESEVKRLEGILAAAEIDSGRHTLMSLRRKVASLEKQLKKSLVASREAMDRMEARRRKEVAGFDAEISRLREAARRSEERHREECATHRRGEVLRHAALVRKVADRDRKIGRLEKRIGRLREGLARATGFVRSLRGKNAALAAGMREMETENRALAARSEQLETENARVRSNRAVLTRHRFGTRSERRGRPGSGRRRGHQRGKAGHGRTPRPNLVERIEEHRPPEEDCLCGRCGRPYAVNGVRETTVVEMEVRVYLRVVRRPRLRRTCECESSPLEVSAPPVPRLFPGTMYGVSVWSRYLFERFACLRPIRRVAAWMGHQGLPVSAGTLADSIPRFLPLMEPVSEAILAHQNGAALRHGDETSWRIRALKEAGRSAKAWLWGSLTGDAAWFHIDPSRSAEVARKLFGADRAGLLFLVVDRLSTYKKLAADLGGVIVLCWCWSHQRRSFIDAAAGHPRLAGWCEGWLDGIAGIYRLNDARMKHYRSRRKKQTAAFNAAQRELEAAVRRLFADAGAELDGLSDQSLRAKPLRSLLNHREGLCVFVDRPGVPMDNNAMERILRDPVIGRGLSLGSDSMEGARLTAMMYSVVVTLKMNGIDVLKWLEDWLGACARNGGQLPGDLSPWLPWKMGKKRRRELAAPP